MDFESETFIVCGRDVAGTIKGRMRGETDDVLDTCVAHALRADGFDASEDGTGRGTPLVPVCQAFYSTESRCDNLPEEGLSPPLKVGSNGGGQPPAVAFSCKDHGADAGDIAPTLRSMEFDGSHANGGGQVAVAFQEAQTGCREYDTAGTLRADGPGHDPVGTRVRSGMAVRRLTPMECERLQGFPDGWTNVPYRGKPAADGPRYKALGNSMAVPVMRWILGRVQFVDAVMREREPK
jgi:DNA (cytosine-5)-methyltransferase 1